MTDYPEADELEAAAAWRWRKADANPSEPINAQAAHHLQALADDLRASGTTALVAELRCIRNWLAESDGIEDFNEFAHEYRTEIGIIHRPETGEAYIKALIALAKDSFGAA